jgi:hypothetical protein
MRFIAFGGVYQGRRIEMPVMVGDELGDGTFVHDSVYFVYGRQK